MPHTSSSDTLPGETQPGESRSNDSAADGLLSPRSGPSEEAEGVETQRVRAVVEERLFGVTAERMQIGRFALLGLLGQGGMGRVYRAYDPELDRKVAIKIVRPGHGTHGDRARERLVREARTMARLSDPNVITIHEVGQTGDEVHLVMEYVEGRSFAQWLAEHPLGERRLDDVIDTMLQAAKGLAAAHRVGVVHRDFKPANVLVRNDGRVVVADFGLARVDPMREQTTHRLSLDDDATPGDLSGSTSAGSIAGTPAYLAPESLDGLCTERTDQFAYFVTFYEAVYGRRPFEGFTLAELLAKLSLCEPPEPPADVAAPRWLRQVIERGLRREPEERWPSMQAVVSELDRHRPGPRRWLLPLLTAGAAAGAVAVYVGATDAPERCAAPVDAFAGVWDDETRTALAERFAGSPHAYAKDSAEAIRRALDAYRDEWLRAHTEACEATFVRGEQSEAMLDRRMHCLHRRRQELGGLVVAMSGGGDETLREALGEATTLVPVRVCRDVERLAEQGVPEDPEVRARVEALAARVAQARSTARLGALPAAEVEFEALVGEAREIAFAPALAETLVRAAWVARELDHYDPAERFAIEAIEVGSAGGADDAVAEAWTELMMTRHVRGETSRARELELAAIAATKRTHDAPRARISLLDTLGSLDLAAGELERAWDRKLEAWELATAFHGPTHPSLGWPLLSLGNVRFKQAKPAEALAFIVAGLANRLANYGPHHPETAAAYNNLAGVAYQLGQYEAALGAFERVIAIRRDAFGERHSTLASTYSNLGSALQRLGRYDEAIVAHRQSVAIGEATFGPNHREVAISLSNLANAERTAGQLDAAIEHQERALAIKLETLGPEHDSVATSYQNLGATLADAGRLDEAMAALERSVRIYDASLGPQHPTSAGPLARWGAILVDQGRPERARPLLERALANQTATPVDPFDLAYTRAQLGRALWQLGERSRAVELGTSALATFETAATVWQQDIDAIRAWLAPQGSGRLSGNDSAK